MIDIIKTDWGWIGTNPMEPDGQDIKIEWKN
jgi:hypothetical protein